MADFRDEKHQKWAKKVKQRDNYTCQLCFASGSGVYLHSHHLNSWDLFPDQRYQLDNGITLCNQCHFSFHKISGLGTNTKYQFEQFKVLFQTIKKVAK